MDGVDSAENSSGRHDASALPSALKRRRPTGYVYKSKFAVHCENIQNVLNRKKTLGEDLLNTSLKRCLNTFDMCLLGVGHMIGAGIYVLTGEVAKHTAGPSILVSYIIAGITSFLSALCYAEFATRVPKAGSAYIYTYVTIGEFWAFVIGWDVILEHMLGAASVAKAWSGYLDGLLHNAIKNGTMEYITWFHVHFISEYPDFVAFGVCLIVCLLLVVGVKFSSLFNSVFTGINLLVIIFIICVGSYFSSIKNWTNVPGGFFAFGFSGVIAGAGKCFFAFIGFDSIATSSEEAKTPAKSIPLATLLCMAISTSAYCTMSIVLTMMIPYTQITAAAAFPSAFEAHGATWAQYVVSVGALAGMTTTMFGSLFSLPRTVYAMAMDGLLFPFFAYVHPKTQTPIITLVVCSLVTASIALLFDLSSLVDFMSIGTLMAYTIVSVSVIILRYQPAKVPASDANSENSTSKTDHIIDDGGTVRYHYKYIRFLEDFAPGRVPLVATLLITIGFIVFCLMMQFGFYYISQAAWWAIVILIIDVALVVFCFFILYVHEQSSQKLVFRVPLVPVLPALSIVTNVFLMVNLDWKTWVRFVVWMLLGMTIYFSYGVRHSKERKQTNITISTTQLMLPEFIAPVIVPTKLPSNVDTTPNEYYVTRF